LDRHQEIAAVDTIGDEAMKPTFEQEQAAIRLWTLTSKHTSGQGRYVGLFLLSIYNGQRFPFDLTNFRCLDTAIFNDCMAVLYADHRPAQEIHDMLVRLLPDDSVDFEAMAVRLGMQPKLVSHERSYEITSRPSDLGGGWNLHLFEDGVDQGGGVFPADDEDGYDEAVEIGESWVARSHCAS
jgi:hypothetical protein